MPVHNNRTVRISRRKHSAQKRMFEVKKDIIKNNDYTVLRKMFANINDVNAKTDYLFMKANINLNDKVEPQSNIVVTGSVLKQENFKMMILGMIGLYVKRLKTKEEVDMLLMEINERYKSK